MSHPVNAIPFDLHQTILVSWFDDVGRIKLEPNPGYKVVLLKGAPDPVPFQQRWTFRWWVAAALTIEFDAVRGAGEKVVRMDIPDPVPISTVTLQHALWDFWEKTHGTFHNEGDTPIVRG